MAMPRGGAVQRADDTRPGCPYCRAFWWKRWMFSKLNPGSPIGAVNGTSFFVMEEDINFLTDSHLLPGNRTAETTIFPFTESPHHVLRLRLVRQGRTMNVPTLGLRRPSPGGRLNGWTVPGPATCSLVEDLVETRKVESISALNFSRKRREEDSAVPAVDQVGALVPFRWLEPCAGELIGSSPSLPVARTPPAKSRPLKFLKLKRMVPEAYSPPGSTGSSLVTPQR